MLINFFHYNFTDLNTEYGKYTVNKKEKEDVYFLSVEDQPTIDKKWKKKKVE